MRRSQVATKKQNNTSRDNGEETQRVPATSVVFSPVTKILSRPAHSKNMENACGMVLKNFCVLFD